MSFAFSHTLSFALIPTACVCNNAHANPISNKQATDETKDLKKPCPTHILGWKSNTNSIAFYLSNFTDYFLVPMFSIISSKLVLPNRSKKSSKKVIDFIFCSIKTYFSIAKETTSVRSPISID